MKRILPISMVLFFVACSLQLTGQLELKFTLWKSGFSSPVDIANAGDDRLFIVEKRGYIRIVDGSGNILATPFMDIDSRVSSNGERGLLGLAFHPDYENNGYFFVNYTNNSGDTRISRFEKDAADPDLADVSSEVILLEIDQPQSNHNAGDIEFGPDGYLYIPLGDGGGGGDPGNRSQNLNCLLGKMLRIDVDTLSDNLPASTSQTGGSCNFTSSVHYKIPNDNPFIDSSSTLNEIWSIGLRNPWRFSFDSANGDMWIADVGQGQWEEVDYEASNDGGKNYGWRCYEGDHSYNTSGCDDESTYDDPIFEYDHNDGRSITGGFVYRGSDFPNLTGYYIMADYATDEVWALLKGSGNTIIDTVTYSLPDTIYSISTFGVDSNNELYAANLSDGTIYLVEDLSAPLPVELISFKGAHEKGINLLRWETSQEENFDYFDIEKSMDGQRFQTIGAVESLNNNNNNNTYKAYQFEDQYPESGTSYYRLKMVDTDGQFTYSKIIEIQATKTIQLILSPNPNNGQFNIIADLPIQEKIVINIYNTTGELVLSDQQEPTKRIEKNYDLSQYPKGVYLLQIQTGTYSKTINLIYR